MRKRGRCDSALCRARSALTVYLDKLLDGKEELKLIDRERNTNYTLLSLLVGNRVKVFRVDLPTTTTWEQVEPQIPSELYVVLFELEHEVDDKW